MVLGRLNIDNLPLLSTSWGSVERVTSFKLLGINLDAKLSWSLHINIISAKASKRLYFLKQLNWEQGFPRINSCIFMLQRSALCWSSLLHPGLALCHHPRTGSKLRVHTKTCHSHYIPVHPWTVLYSLCPLCSWTNLIRSKARQTFQGFFPGCLWPIIPHSSSPSQHISPLPAQSSYTHFPRLTSRTKKHCSFIISAKWT